VNYDNNITKLSSSNSGGDAGTIQRVNKKVLDLENASK